MFDVVAAVNDDKVLARNLLRSPMLAAPDVRLHIQRGHRTAGSAYNAAIRASTQALIVLAHQDVYIPAPWRERITAITARLSAADPNWGVLGCYGITGERRHVGYVWSSGLNRVLGEPAFASTEVDSVDELLIVLRRSAGLMFDENLPGFHLYGTDIVQTARAAGRSAYVVCAPVVHNSRPVPFLPRDYLAAHAFLRRKWKHRLPIQNCIAPIVASPIPQLRRKLRCWAETIRRGAAGQARVDRHFDAVEISQRLQFERA
jgi:hypothetical protein